MGLCVLALAGGAALARLSGPLACRWPARGRAMLARLRAVKLYRRPGRGRTALGAVLLAALLGAGALAAYAAEPSAPQQLARAVTGVVRSGDQLSLSLKEARAAPRTLKVGDQYNDGWKLAAITPTSAVLTKDGASAQVDLSPALAAPAPVGSAPGSAAGSSVLQQLPKAFAGVATGDPMGLNLNEDGAARTLKVGDEYKDGWRLAAVLSTGAVFTKDGATAELALGPAGEAAGAVRDLPPSQTQIDRANNERRNAEIAALRAAQGNPIPTPAQLAQTQRNNANIALVTAQNRYIRASTLMSMASAIMREANTDDFGKAMQGPGAQRWADVVYQVCGGGDDCTYDKLKAVVANGPPMAPSTP
jgi:hypothetical protein